jgi:Na+/phosphate symporter
MKKLLGILLILIGVVLILFSIAVLVKAFDAFTAKESSFEAIGYTLGNIIFPLIITVFGRWVYRKGRALFSS